MSDRTPGLHPVTGRGVLSRHGELILLCSADDASSPVVDDILSAHEDVADSGGDGAALADRVAALLADAPETSVIAFGPVGASVSVAVFGHAWADVTTEHGEQRLALRQSRDGVRSVVPGTLLSIRAGLGEIDVDAIPQQWGNLVHGSVHAVGLLYVASDAAMTAAVEPPPARPAESTAELPRIANEEFPSGPASAPLAPNPPTSDPAPDPTDQATAAAPATSPEPPAAAPSTPSIDRSQPFSSVVLFNAVGTSPQSPERAPLPIVARPPEPVAPEVAPAPHPAPDHSVQVLGVYCKNGHFDDPAARYCAICGISMAQLTLVPRPGPRPPLGVLVLDDGSIFSIDTDYVIGRDPFRDQRVTGGAARPMRVSDAQGLISRAHAHIRLDGWQVQVVDLGSANGTGILGPGDSGWRSIPRLTPVTIRPGTQVGFGQRKLRYESHRNT